MNQTVVAATGAAATPIRNQRAPMAYRRFGRTNQVLSAVTLGGMRYIDGHKQPRDEVSKEMLEQCCRMITLSLDAGVNHIETAHGYGRSEHCYGLALNRELNIPRSRYHLMTKGGPATAEQARRDIDIQLKGLKTDHIDLYAWHGINTPDIRKSVTAKGGPVEELLKMKQEGIIGAVGFSTHAPYEVIIDSLATDLFDFVNLHYYYFFQRHAGAVAYAAAKDIGVFIISPNDKGGQLFNPPKLLRDLCAPLTPIQFNARWCLRTPMVHTLSFGMTEPAHVEEMKGIFPANYPLTPEELAIQVKLDSRIAVAPECAWEGYEMQHDLSGINIPEVLRFRKLMKCYDMKDFGLYRYNMLQSKGHWFPGTFATEDALAKVDASKAPAGMDVVGMLRETHRELYKVPKG